MSGRRHVHVHGEGEPGAAALVRPRRSRPGGRPSLAVQIATILVSTGPSTRRTRHRRIRGGRQRLRRWLHRQEAANQDVPLVHALPRRPEDGHGPRLDGHPSGIAAWRRPAAWSCNKLWPQQMTKLKTTPGRPIRTRRTARKNSNKCLDQGDDQPYETKAKPAQKYLGTGRARPPYRVRLSEGTARSASTAVPRRLLHRDQGPQRRIGLLQVTEMATARHHGQWCRAAASPARPGAPVCQAVARAAEDDVRPRPGRPGKPSGESSEELGFGAASPRRRAISGSPDGDGRMKERKKYGRKGALQELPVLELLIGLASWNTARGPNQC